MEGTKNDIYTDSKKILSLSLFFVPPPFNTHKNNIACPNAIAFGHQEDKAVG
jgi:hypothetical protein